MAHMMKYRMMVAPVQDPAKEPLQSCPGVLIQSVDADLSFEWN